MMPAAKHGDPQMGVDIHLCTVPSPLGPVPVPLPTPHTSVVFDPMDYLPIIGATITVCGMKRATAGTTGKVVHIPPGFPFAPKLPDTEDELFMGSATVLADGDPFSHLSHPVLACQVAGMPSPPRPRKKGGPRMMLAPTVFNLAIPVNVFIGGPPMISLFGLAAKFGFAAIGKFLKSGFFKKIRQKIFKKMKPGKLKCNILRAEPVNILSGSVSVEHEDFNIPGRIPIEWRRTYSSDLERMGSCGYGWETPADIRLSVERESGAVIMYHPTDSPRVFERLPQSEKPDDFQLELMDGATLTDDGQSYCVRTKEGQTYHFPKHLIIETLEGDAELPLGQISDPSGNWLKFKRQSGQLVAIQESAGRTITIQNQDGKITAINLQVDRQEQPQTFVSYAYDNEDNLTGATDPLGHTYSFGYDDHRMVRHTDRNGLSFYYAYEVSEQGEYRVVHAWGDEGLYDYQFEYLDILNERRITDSLGHVSTIKLNESGLPISEIDPLGGMTIYEYDEVGRTIAVTDQDSHRTEYEYDGYGNLLKLTRPDGASIQTTFDEQHRAIAITDPNGGQWSQAWDESGLLAKQATPLGHESHYKYDKQGQLHTFINPKKASSLLEFDHLGNLASLTDTLEHQTQFTYDRLGNVTQKTDPLKRKTTYQYDAKSRLTDVKLPSGSTIHCAYDPEDNLILYRDENGAETRLKYFGQGEIAKRIQPDGHTVSYHYDTEERLTGVTNQRGETYQLKRDELGRIVEEIDYWGQSRQYDYSACGYIQRSTDPLGRAIDFTTDPLGRILQKILPDPDGGETPFEESFAYDANGNLTACSNPHIEVERSFDDEGRLLEEKQGDGFTITNAYDETGNRIARETQFKHADRTVEHQIQYDYDLLDQVSHITIDNNPAIAIEYDAAGQLVREQLSPTLHKAIEYNTDGYLTRQQVHGKDADPIVEIAYNYDAAGNLTERHDAEFGIDKYIYDPVGRITSHLDPQGKVQRYLNDPAGDRLQTRITQKAANDDSPDNKATEWSRQGEHEGAFYRFDRAGNLVERRDELGELILRWDANQRLIETRLESVSTCYQYDPLGRRIQKCTGDRSTHFAWDGDALVADNVDIQHETGVLTSGKAREWVYYPETFEPLAMLNGEGENSLLHYHNDPNGCPVRMTDSDGVVKWAASYTVWGRIAKLHVDLVDNPLRLQGQYADSETHLAYNRFRLYDPQVGQFVTDDPLGLFAGDNTYSFARNTLAWIDPLGLSCSKKISFKDWIKKKSKKGNDTHVYIGYKNGKPVYVGIAKNVEARAAQHGDRFDELIPLTKKPLNRGEARAIEQAIIDNNSHFTNKINSISPKRDLYQDAKTHGEKWMEDLGISKAFT